ncbi:papain-like cysteine peptidase [Gammaproteobacteria bacterium]|nr:papain-like cysteine peptidase [Gammaproteobacteria bacterium]
MVPIIVITPFVKNKADYRLYNLEKNKKNDKVNLAEPYWYSNTHFNVLCLMYGGKAQKRPDILDLEDLGSILEYIDDHYHYNQLVHVPYDIHLNIGALYDIIKNRLFLVYRQIFDNFLDKPFIKYKDNYYQIPVSVVDANSPERFQQTDSLILFDADNQIHDINKFLSRFKPSNNVTSDQVLPMPVGGWCGVAEALKAMGLRDEAYPFDYVRTDLSLIVDLLEIDGSSRGQVSELLFGGRPNEKIEFVHHKSGDDSTKDRFIARTVRFLDRIRTSERPILFVRATPENPDLDTEIRQSRELLATVGKKYHRKGDKLLLIANFHEVSTGKMMILDDGQVRIWNAMGVCGWKVPNNWHVVTNFIKIIAHELRYFDQGTEVNYRSRSTERSIRVAIARRCSHERR